MDRSAPGTTLFSAHELDPWRRWNAQGTRPVRARASPTQSCLGGRRPQSAPRGALTAVGGGRRPPPRLRCAVSDLVEVTGAVRVQSRAPTEASEVPGLVALPM